MTKDKVSIIVPIYNTEQYLEKCINSLIKQTYKNIEIVLINDGSTDNSGIICKRYKEKDDRIVYIDKKNTGVSDSRNLGIEISDGEYILFVDSDDYIELNMIEFLYNNIKKYNADLSVCEHRNCIEKIELLNKEQAMLSIFDLNGIQGYACSKLYKSQIIKEQNIKFNKKIYICEDLLFNVEYVQHINKCIYDSQKKYNYVFRSDSALNDKFNEKKLTSLDAYEKIYKIYNKIDNQYIKDNFLYYYVLLNLNQKMLIKINNYKNNEIKNRINENISTKIKIVLKSKNIDIKYKVNIFIRHYFFKLIYILKLIKIKLIKKG